MAITTTAVAVSGGGGSLPGGMTKDPKHLPAFQGQVRLYDSTTQHAPNAPNFWAELGRGGAYVTGAVDDTYKEICSLTGSGSLFHVVPPAHTNNTDTVSFKITVDGVEHEIVKSETWGTSNNAIFRVTLGICEGYYDYQSGDYTPRYDFADTEQYTTFVKAINHTMMPPTTIINKGGVFVRFEESLIVEVKVTDVDADTYSDYCGAAYILD